MRFRAALILAFLLAFSGSRARARDGGSAVLVLVEPGTTSLSRRLREEIESLGLRVELLPDRRDSSLEAQAREAGAVAAIRVAPVRGGAVQMSIVDRATGKIVHRKLAIASHTDPAAAELIATRTVELLRASLMELSAAHPPRGEIEVTPAVRQLVAASPGTPGDAEELAGTTDRGSGIQKFSFAAGPALVYSAHWQPGIHAAAGVTWSLTERLALAAGLALPVTAAELSVNEGQVELRATHYRLGAAVALGPARAVVSARLLAGIAVNRLELDGAASSPEYVGEDDDVLVASPWVGAALRLRLSRNLAVLGEVVTSIALPRTTIRVAGRELHDWGRPAVWATTGLELSWP